VFIIRIQQNGGHKRITTQLQPFSLVPY